MMGLFPILRPVILLIFGILEFMALVCLVIQVVTGVALAMHYAPEINLAFYSVEHIYA